MSTITKEQETAIQAWLDTHDLPKGLGTEESACSIATINLALSGKLTDAIPDCMSGVIGQWIIKIQDSMPAEMRNSRQWKSLLPKAAGTGRDAEGKRIRIILEWMWETVLPSIQSIADEYGFAEVWAYMLKEKTSTSAARAAADAADAAYAAAYAADAAALAATRAATRAAADAADAAADAAYAAARAAARAAAYSAAYSAADAADAAAYAAAWKQFDPCGLLKQLIEV